MHITIKRADLVRLLSAVDKVVETRNHIPILSNVLLTAEPASLTARGTDNDIEVSTSCVAECTPGSTTVPAKRLLEIARKVVGDEVSLSLVDNTLTVKSGRSNFKIQTLPPDSFPSIQGGDFPHTFEADFSELLPPVAFAIAADDKARFFLEGVYVHEEDGQLRSVGADGNRLAYRVGGPCKPFPGIILGRKIVGLLSAITGPVTAEVSDRQIRVVAGDTTFVAKLIESSYIDYQKFWPKNLTALQTDRAELKAAVSRVGLVADERARGVRFGLRKDIIRLTAHGSSGESSEDVPASYSGSDIDTGFSVDYLAEMLAHVPGDTVELALNDAGTSMVLTGSPGWQGILQRYRV